MLVESGFGEALGNRLLDARFLFRTKQTPVDAALDRIEQFQPVFQRRLVDGLPLVVALLPLEKFPVASDVLGIYLERNPFVGDAFPTDFSFGHGDQSCGVSGKSMLATAMAAMPSSRPMKPICSLVVALMPTRSTARLSALAMFSFISWIWG